MAIERINQYKISDGRIFADRAAAEAAERETEALQNIMELYEKNVGVTQNALSFKGGMSLILQSDPKGLRDLLTNYVKRLPKKSVKG